MLAAPVASRTSQFARGTQRRSLRGAPLLHAPARPVARRAAGVPPVEANLFSRLVRVIKSYASSAVSSLEDPEKILDQAVEDMQADLIKLRQGAAEVTASQKRLQAKYEDAQRLADDWYRRAELALSKGDEELAREALTRRKSFQACEGGHRRTGDNATMLKQQLEQQAKAVDTLIGNMRVLENKLAEAKMKKDTLKARAQSAKSAAAISDMVAGLSTSSAVAAFEKMEDKVLAMESAAEAATMLVAPDNLESKFRALEGSAVDDDLDQLKRKLTGSSGPRGALPPGRPLVEAIPEVESELDALRRRRGNGGV
eukprot:scaffold30.g4429.t1